MSISPVEINMKLMDEKVTFEGVSPSNTEHPITFDYVEPLGNGHGYLGLEVLVMSFGGCVSTGIVALLRRMGRTIDRYEIRLEGIKNESPLSLKRINAVVHIESKDITDEDMKATLLKAEQISPVWIAIRNNVEVSIEYVIQG